MASRFTDSRAARDLVLLLVGALVGGGIASGVFLVIDDDDPKPTDGAAAGDSTVEDGDDDEPAIDPTDTEFGELTDESEQRGIRVRWASELLVDGGGDGEFVTAHRDGTLAFIHDDLRIVVAVDQVHLCEGGACRAASIDEARDRLPAPVRPYFEAVRAVAESTASPDYRVTGETELESGIFERCGQYDPTAFGLTMPQGVVTVSQCVDASRNVPLRIGLQGEDASLGGATLTALADAHEGDFATG